MIGADEYYDLINDAFRANVGDIVPLEGDVVGDFRRYGNILFQLGNHARGKTFHMYLVEEPIGKRTDWLEVYGITSGNPGWTETYGWLVKGKWVKYIEDYFLKLRIELDAIRKENFRKDMEEAKIKQKEKQDKIEKFETLFE